MLAVFIAISCLNLSDGIFTSYGLTHGYITEANPVMDAIWQISPVLFLSIKAFFSLIALYVGFVFYKRKIKANRLIKTLWISALLLYIWIFSLHAIWISLVIFNK